MWPFFCRFEVDEVWRAIVTRKKTLRKLSAALLSAAMCFGFLIPVFAEGEGDNPSFAQTENMPVSNTEPSAGNTEISEPQSDASAAQGHPDPTSDQSTESPDAAADDSVQDAEESSDSSSSSDESTSSTDSKPSDSYSEADGEIGKEENDSSEDANEKDGSSEEETPAKTVQFEKTADLIHVTAKTTSDILPEDAEMRVKLYSDQDEEFRAAENALNSSQVNYDGLLVVDVSFWKDEKEIEPEDGTVDVQMSFDKALIGDEKAENSLSVHHISEKDGTSVQQVANEGNQTIQDVSTAYKAEFEVDNFSSFTISWSKNGRTAKVTLTLKDEAGTELKKASTKDFNLTPGQNTETYNLRQFAIENCPTGYVFINGRKAHGGVTDFVDQIRFSYYTEQTGTGSSQRTHDYIQAEYLYQNIVMYSERIDQGTRNCTADLVYVQENADKSLLTFVSNGGNGAAPGVIEGKIGDTIILPKYTGTKEGYTFLGWSTGRNLDSTAPYPLYPAETAFELTEKRHVLYAVWDETNARTDATFFIRKDGHIPDEPGSFPNGQYTGGISLTQVVTERHWIVDTAQESIDGNHAVNGVTKKLAKLPTDDQIKTVLPDFDPENQYIHWYVQKKENNGWHVDGVVLQRGMVVVSYERNCSDTTVNVPMGYQRVRGAQIKVGAQSNQTTIVTPVRNGYVFLGWSLTSEPPEDGHLYQNEELYILTADSTTFYAQWALDLDQLTVMKYIDGNMGDKSRAFKFEVQILNQNGEPYKDASDDTGIKYENGWYKFDLTDGQSYVFKVPKGGKYRVKEDQEEYEPSYTIAGGTHETTQNASDTGGKTFNGRTTVTFHNVKQGTVPGGLHDDGEENSVLVTGGALGILALAACSLIFRKEREHEQR